MSARIGLIRLGRREIVAGVEARFARVEESDEIVRLAGVMFESMGHDPANPEWESEGRRQIRERLGNDLAVLVVEHPDGGSLVSSAAGSVTRRLPGPHNPSGRVGFVQWVATEPAFRRRGFARLTMEGLLTWFGGLGVPSVELFATPDAEGLYRSLGFGETGGRALRRIAGEQHSVPPT